MSTGSNGKEDDRARLVRRAERAEADLDLLIGRFALVSVRSGMRAQALQLAQECITENLANGEGVDSQPAVLDAIFDALKYEIADEPDGARPGAKPPIQSTDALSPVQGERPELRFEDVVWLFDRVNDAGYGGRDGYTDEDIASVGAAMNNVGAWLQANARSDAPRGPSVRRMLGEPASPPVQGEHGQDGEDGENAAVWRGEPVFVGDKNFAQWLKEHRDSHARMGSTTPCVCAGCEWARAQDGDHNEKEQGPP
jgi:hypothetical protein